MKRDRRPQMSRITISAIVLVATSFCAFLVGGCAQNTRVQGPAASAKPSINAQTAMTPEETQFDKTQSPEGGVTVEDLGGEANLGTIEEAAEQQAIDTLHKEAETLEQAAEEKATSHSTDVITEMTLQERAIQTMVVEFARQWHFRFENAAYRKANADFLREGQRRFTATYGVAGQLFKGYTEGGYSYKGVFYDTSDPVMEVEKGADPVFNELLGTDCSHFVYRTLVNVLPKDAIGLPMLTTEWQYDIISAYLAAEAANHNKNLDFATEKELAYSYYQNRIHSKRLLINKSGAARLGPTWEATHLSFFDYYNYVPKGQAVKAGDIGMFVNNKALGPLRERGHTYFILDPQGTNELSALGASSPSKGIRYFKYLPQQSNWYVLRPNYNKLLEEKYQISISEDSP